MRAKYLLLLLVLIGVFSASCGVCNGSGPNHLGTPVPPTTSDDVEGPDIFWGHVNDTLRGLGRAWREAKQLHPNYPTN